MIAFNASFASARVFLYRKGVMVWPSSVARVDTQFGLEGHARRVRSFVIVHHSFLPSNLRSVEMPPAICLTVRK